MSDFSVTVGGDFSELLSGFKQVERTAQQSGQAAGQALGGGIQGAVSRSIDALLADLGRLKAQKASVSVDGSQVAGLTQQITAVQKQIDTLRSARVALQVDPRSVDGLNQKLGELQAELGKVAIGSQRFKELQAAVQSTERELAKAGQSADGFNLIDGAIQGLAFSLTNTVTNAAGSALRAIGGLITGFAELDTEIRQAAAASGESGAYDKIARTIDQVGIEASGSTIEVAKLSTELVRGGMTVDQVNASLGAIVRGAEATGTGFASMGSVVSATLKGFGLQASDSTRVVDALVTGANASATSVEGMGMAFKYAAPVAKILGVSVEDLGIVVGLMTNTGIEASEAGVTLRNGLSQLATAAPKAGGGISGLTGQAKKAAETMKQLGLNIYNADGTLKPMQETLLTLKGAFDKLGPASKLNLASNLFGGTDDGAKWISALSQSREEIIKMSTTMANTKGATDTARDAMQGFGMAMKQLGGTMDSLGNTIGSVAATALMPLVDIANLAVGVIAGLPTPIKAAGAALILMAGAVTAATAAMVIFQRTMQVTAVQAAAAEIKALAAVMITNLKGAATVAIAAVDALLTAIKGFTIQSFFDSITTLGSAIKVKLVAAFEAASTAFAGLVKSIKSGAFANAAQGMIGQIGAVTAGIAKFAYVIGPIALAIAIVSKAMEGGAEAGERYKRANDTIVSALAKLRSDLDSTKIKMEDSRNVFQKLYDSFAEGARVMGDIDATNAIAKSVGNLTKESNAYLATLQNTTTLTDKQRQQALAYVAALQATGGAARQLAQQYTVLADKAALMGDKKQEEVYRKAAELLQKQADSAANASGALSKKAQITAQDVVATGKATEATKEQVKAEADLDKLRKEAPVRDLEARIAVGQQLLGLTKSIGDLEQSRFSVAKAGLQFELKALEDRGASESTIAAKKAEIDQADRAALSARYQSLLQQQALEQEMLRLSQEKARAEANLDVKRQQIKLLEEEINLRNLGKNASQEDRDVAQAKINLQKEILGISQEQVGILDKTQPLERAIAAATAETARNGLQAQAAAEGYTIAADGSLVKTQGLATSLQSVAVFSGKSADEQDRYRQIAEQSGLAIGKAADGSVVLGKTQQDVNKAVGDLNKQLDSTKGGYDAAGKAAGATKTATEQAGQALQIAGQKAGDLSKGVEGAAKGAGAAKTAADGLGKSLDAGKTPAGDIANAFVKVGEKAPAAVQGARDFAGWLSSAKTFAEKIAGLNLGKQMTDVSNATKEAAKAAESFFTWLQRASGLPGSRWSGGPVEAGSEYRINELGQEAFLSAGRLSMIQAPANAIWRAPSSGVVIPAGITARLQDAGALPSPGGIAAVGGNAELAIEIGKLRQEVGELARKKWDINVTQRTGPTGSQVLRTLQQLR